MKNAIRHTARGLTQQLNLFLFVFFSAHFVLSHGAEAQQKRESTPTVGWLWYGAAPSGSLPTLESGIVDGLRELGYVEGKNFKLEYRYAQGKPEKLVDLAGQLAAQNVDLIVALGGDVVAAAKKVTSAIPIVMGVSEDPVRASLVNSLARPGGNATGVSFLSNDLAGKRLEILKEIIPSSRVLRFCGIPLTSTTNSA